MGDVGGEDSVAADKYGRRGSGGTDKGKRAEHTEEEEKNKRRDRGRKTRRRAPKARGGGRRGGWKAGRVAGFRCLVSPPPTNTLFR